MSVALGMAALAAGLLFAVARARKGKAATASGVLEKVKAGAKIVDVRTPEEFARGAYPGAVNIPLAALPRRLDEIPRGKPVVVYCASGMRSAAARRTLEEAGYAEVLDAGGLADMPR